MFPHTCPNCGTKNEDDWPVKVDGNIASGGCQECWETQTSQEWWEQIRMVEREVATQDILDEMLQGKITVDEARDRLDHMEFQDQMAAHNKTPSVTKRFKNWIMGALGRRHE